MAGTQVITLTGDEASLFKAFQKIIDQQNKVDEGYKKTKDESKKASDSAVKDAERTERENKKAADAIFAEHQKMLDNKARETRQAALEEQSIIRRTALQEVQDMTKAADQMIAEAEKVGREKKKLAEDHTRRTSQQNSEQLLSVQTLAQGVVGLGTAYFGISTPLELIKSLHQDIQEAQKKTLDMTLSLAAAQQEAAKNMAGTPNAVLNNALQKAAPDIMINAGFSDASSVTGALGSTASIVGVEKSIGIVEEVAKVTRLSPDQLKPTSTAVGDMMKAVPSLAPAQALAGIMSLGANARPEDIPHLAQGAARSITATLGAAPKQDKEQAAREGMALFAEFTRLDPTGEAAANSEGAYVEELSKFFSANTPEAEARTKKIKEIKDRSDKQRLDLDKSAIAIQIAEKKALRFHGKDTIEARDARMQVLLAKQTRDDLARRIADDSTELTSLEKQADFARRDPGTALGRQEMIARDPIARDRFTRELSGDRRFHPIIKELLDPTSEASARVSDMSKSITFDANKWNDTLQTVVLTTQQQIAANREARKARKNVNRMERPQDAIIADLEESFQEALAESSIDMNTAAENIYLKTSFSPENAAMRPDERASVMAVTLRNRLRYLKQERANPGMIKDLESVIPTVEREAKTLISMEKMERGLAEQNELMRENNQLLKRQIGIAEQRNIPPANAIRNQVEQSRN